MPRWQRKITTHTGELFPNVQFIVTAHSPLVVQAPGVTNVAVLRREGDQVRIINDPEEVRGWRVDQMDRALTREAMPWRAEVLLMNANDLLHQLELDAEQGRTLGIPSR